MNTKPDQVVKEWINRSAGQHQRRVSEGTASARRICHLQTDEEAATLKMWQASEMLPHVDYSKVGRRDGVSVGACCTGDCNQGRDCPEREEGEMPLIDSVLLWVACCVLLIAALSATAPELVLMLLGLI